MVNFIRAIVMFKTVTFHFDFIKRETLLKHKLFLNLRNVK